MKAAYRLFSRKGVFYTQKNSTGRQESLHTRDRQEAEQLLAAKNMAESTLTAIMGRESAYTGQPIEWDQALNSKLRLGPDKYEFGPLPFPKVPMPGDYKFA